MITPQMEEIEELKAAGKLDEALDVTRNLLSLNPRNKDALYQVADIMYRKGEIIKAEKPIDFLLDQEPDDAMSQYIKGVLEMEKTNRQEAKGYLKKAIKLLEEDNPEMMRCYALCEYRSGNKEEGMRYLKQAFDANALDAEIVLNLIELHIQQHERKHAQRYIKYYHTHREELQFFDKSGDYYDEKVLLFTEYVSYHLEKK